MICLLSLYPSAVGCWMCSLLPVGTRSVSSPLYPFCAFSPSLVHHLHRHTIHLILRLIVKFCSFLPLIVSRSFLCRIENGFARIYVGSLRKSSRISGRFHCLVTAVVSYTMQCDISVRFGNNIRFEPLKGTFYTAR